MRSDDLQIEIRGSVSEPPDLVTAAQRSMTPDQFDVFVKRYGDMFTADDLADYVTELRYGTRD